MKWKRAYQWFKETLLPKTVFLPFWIARLIPAGPFGLSQMKKEKGIHTKLLIEAGVMGWQSIEFKEMYTSACEYIGCTQVFKLAIEKDKNYPAQVRHALDRIRPTHYLYDPRTASQFWLKGLLESFAVALGLRKRGVVPIALLTDFSHRLWRAQSAVVTAKQGVVISCLSPKEGFPIFPHGRLAGPTLMPLSCKTMDFLDALKREVPDSHKKKATFIGSLYEPRITILNHIKCKLADQGYILDIHGRPVGGKRRPDDEYWARLSHSYLILTTAEQIDLPINDWQWITQLTYRYMETMAAGSLLVAPEIPGVRRFFIPDEHFVSFKSPEHAVQKIEYYLSHEPERHRIAECGRKRARQIVDLHLFWVCVDAALGKDALT